MLPTETALGVSCRLGHSVAVPITIDGRDISHCQLRVTVESEAIRVTDAQVAVEGLGTGQSVTTYIELTAIIPAQDVWVQIEAQADNIIQGARFFVKII
jgi:hypothetical protein